MVVGDEGQGEVDAGGDSGRRPHVAVADVDGVSVDGDVRVVVAEQATFSPVSGGSAPVEQSGCGEYERSRTHRGDPAGIRGEPSYLMEKLLVAGRGVHVRAAGHHHRVDGSGDLTDRRRRELKAAAGGDRAAVSRDHIGSVPHRRKEPGGGGEDLEGAGDVEDLSRVEGRDDDARFPHRRSIRAR